MAATTPASRQPACWGLLVWFLFLGLRGLGFWGFWGLLVWFLFWGSCLGSGIGVEGLGFWVFWGFGGFGVLGFGGFRVSGF